MGYKGLETWLAEVIENAENRGKLTAIVCSLETQTGGTKEVHTQLTEGRTWDPALLFRIFKGRAETYVQDRPGLHTFVCSAFYDGKASPDGPPHTFVVQDGEMRANGQNRVVAEHPNLAGVTAQLMRHNEDSNRTIVTLVQGFMGEFANERRSLYEELRHLRNETNEAYGIVRELIMANSQQQHAMKMDELRYARETGERDRMARMLPGVINGVAGTEVVPAGDSDTALIDEMAAKINPDHLDGLVQMGMLSKEQAGALKLRFAQARAKKEAEAKILAAVPEGDTSEGLATVTPLAVRKKAGGDS